MSTTSHAVLILGYKAQFEKITVEEPRFDPKTGLESTPEKVFKEWTLKIEDWTIWSGKEKWMADEELNPSLGIRVYVNNQDKVYVGNILGDCSNGEVEKIPPFNPSEGFILPFTPKEPPSLWLIQDFS